MYNNPALPSDGNEKGRWAERLAEQWLKSQGLTPHAHNYTRRLGEIDLVLRDENQEAWVFVEVKYRGMNAIVSGVDAITPAKQRKLYRTAELFLQHIRDQTSAARIDVVVITQCAKAMATPDQYSDQYNENIGTLKSESESESEYGHYRAHLGDHELLWIQNAILG